MRKRVAKKVLKNATKLNYKKKTLREAAKRMHHANVKWQMQEIAKHGI